jgi:tRNA(Ile)-lysidine synthase
VLLHALNFLKGKRHYLLAAIHVHHNLSPNADAWTKFCRAYCRRLGVPLTVRRVKVGEGGEGLEAAARRARYAVFKSVPCDFLLLAHHLDDQAETILMNLLRGAGVRGASGMPARAALNGKILLRPFLGLTRAAIESYARAQGLDWIEDESNADETRTRNFIRRRVGPLLESRFPRWKEGLARSARHFAAADVDAKLLLREFLASRGLRAPTEARLIEMLKQLTSGGARTAVAHDGARLRTYRGKVVLDRAADGARFEPVAWRGERSVAIPGLGGELRFQRARGNGIALDSTAKKTFSIRMRSGGERLQPDARRPRRTLKNLFQEAGIPAWERERLPLLYCGEDLVWVPGLGIDARYQAQKNGYGLVPEWRR